MARWRNKELGPGTFVAGSVGVALMLIGCLVFAGQVIVWLRRLRWPSVTMAWMLGDFWIRWIAPLVQPWVRISHRELNEFVLGVLDVLPLALCLIIVGAALVYRATHVRR
jgi:hypothetical protein